MSEDVENSLEQPAKLVGGITGKGWLPGVSGNPAGRPSEHKRLKELARQLGDRAIEGLLKEATEGESGAARIAAWREILDRGFGKPTIGEPDEDGRQSGGICLTWGDGTT